MDIAVVHNFGEHLGGGDLVALDMMEALLNEGHNVWLYTSYPQGLNITINCFLKDERLAEKVEVRSVPVPEAVRHPYNIYLMTRKAIGELKKLNLVVFFDDIPKLALELRKILVYVNYPHIARILLDQLVPYRYRHSLKGRVVWEAHSLLFKRCFLTDWNKPNIFVAVNSTLTYRHVAKALRPKHITKIYPPVQVEQVTRYVEGSDDNKENFAVYIGRIQPEKGIADIIKALALVKNSGIGIKIMGFLFDEKYLKHLINLAKKLGVEGNVEIMPNAPRRTVLESLAKAKVLVHPAHYEPFGISVIEGMVARCLPIVRKGFNGPWLDIVREGKYGFGFSNVKELTDVVKRAVDFYDSLNVKAVVSRALDFNEVRFKQKFVNMLRSLYS